MNLSPQTYAARAEGAPYECPLAPSCKSTFGRKADRDRHYDDIHLGKKVQCPVEGCPQQIRKDKIPSHIRDKHPGHLNVSTHRSGSSYPAGNNSDSPNSASATPRQLEVFKTPQAIIPYPQIEALRRVQALEYLCAYCLHIDLLPGRTEALRPPLLAGVYDLSSSPASMSNGVDPGIEMEVWHFASTRLPPHVLNQPYPAEHSLAPPQLISMRATRDVFPSPMPRNAAPSSIEIPISVFEDAQAVPVQPLASHQGYSYNSQVVPSTMNEPPTVTTRNSPTYVATDKRSDITTRYTPSNLYHGPYTPATFAQPQSYAIDESQPDSDSDYFPPSVAVGIDQFRGHTGENIPPGDDYTYTNSFSSSMLGQSQDINTEDSLPYQDEIYPMPPSAEAIPSNIDPRLCLPMASPSP